jgi:hypothetical protein
MTDPEETDCTPEPISLADGEIVIVDPVDLAELTDAVAFENRDHALYVLGRKSRKWTTAEDAMKAPANGKLVAIKP